MTQNKPNLLFLFSGQHAQRVSACYCDDIAQTPALDRLAGQGVTFDTCYSPICVPSRMSALSACYPHRQNCWTSDDYLPSDRATWLHAMGPDQRQDYFSRDTDDHSPNGAEVIIGAYRG